MIGLVSTILVLASAATDPYPMPPVLINGGVDESIRFHNYGVMEYGHGGMYNISSGNMDGVEFSEGFQLGADTMRRTGDCFLVRTDKETVSRKHQLGFKLLVFAFGKIRYRGKYMSGYFKVKDNVLYQEYSTRNSTSSCKVTVDQFKFTKFDDIEYETSKPLSEDGKLPEDFKEALLKHVNAKQKKTELEKALQRSTCDSIFRRVGVDVIEKL